MGHKLQKRMDKFVEERSKVLNDLLHSILPLCHGTNERECIYVLMAAICHIMAHSQDEVITKEWVANLLKVLFDDENLIFH